MSLEYAKLISLFPQEEKHNKSSDSIDSNLLDFNNNPSKRNNKIGPDEYFSNKKFEVTNKHRLTSMMSNVSTNITLNKNNSTRQSSNEDALYKTVSSYNRKFKNKEYQFKEKEIESLNKLPAMISTTRDIIKSTLDIRNKKANINNDIKTLNDVKGPIMNKTHIAKRLEKMNLTQALLDNERKNQDMLKEITKLELNNESINNKHDYNVFNKHNKFASLNINDHLVDLPDKNKKKLSANLKSNILSKYDNHQESDRQRVIDLVKWEKSYLNNDLMINRRNKIGESVNSANDYIKRVSVSGSMVTPPSNSNNSKDKKIKKHSNRKTHNDHLLSNFFNIGKTYLSINTIILLNDTGDIVKLLKKYADFVIEDSELEVLTIFLKNIQLTKQSFNFNLFISDKKEKNMKIKIVDYDNPKEILEYASARSDYEKLNSVDQYRAIIKSKIIRENAQRNFLKNNILEVYKKKINVMENEKIINSSKRSILLMKEKIVNINKALHPKLSMLSDKKNALNIAYNKAIWKYNNKMSKIEDMLNNKSNSTTQVFKSKKNKLAKLLCGDSLRKDSKDKNISSFAMSSYNIINKKTNNEIFNNILHRQSINSNINDKTDSIEENSSGKNNNLDMTRDSVTIIEELYSNKDSYKNPKYIKKIIDVVEDEYIQEKFKEEGKIKKLNDKIEACKAKIIKKEMENSELNQEIIELNKTVKQNVLIQIDYYKSMLKRGVDIRKEGLVWVIKRLIELNMSNFEYSMFPKYYKKETVDTLIAIAFKEIELAQTKIVYSHLKNELKNNKDKEKDIYVDKVNFKIKEMYRKESPFKRSNIDYQEKRKNVEFNSGLVKEYGKIFSNDNQFKLEKLETGISSEFTHINPTQVPSYQVSDESKSEKSKKSNLNNKIVEYYSKEQELEEENFIDRLIEYLKIEIKNKLSKTHFQGKDSFNPYNKKLNTIDKGVSIFDPHYKPNINSRFFEKTRNLFGDEMNELEIKESNAQFIDLYSYIQYIKELENSIALIKNSFSEVIEKNYKKEYMSTNNALTYDLNYVSVFGNGVIF